MHQQKGFTFIEVVIVIAIVSVISGIAVPVYFNLKPSMQINGAARQIMGDLMWARMKAVSENNDYAIAFGTTTNSYKIYDDNDNDFGSSNIEENELVKSVTIPEEYVGVRYGFVTGMVDTSGNPLNGDPVKFPWQGSGIYWFRFEPTGRTGAAGFGSIYIIPNEDKVNGRTDRSRAITIISTGRVRIYNYTGTEWK